MKSRLTYRGPLALYISYFVLMALSVSLIVLSFRVDTSSVLFLQLLITGIFATLISFSLILYSTQIDRKIESSKWLKDANTYYSDEGVFDYTHNGFTLITSGGKSLNIRWRDITKVESYEKKVNDYLKKSCINIFFSDKDLITVDSTMSGFTLFEKRIKENMREEWKKQAAPAVMGEENKARSSKFS